MSRVGYIELIVEWHTTLSNLSRSQRFLQFVTAYCDNM
jgi:hypothetical protein